MIFLPTLAGAALSGSAMAGPVPPVLGYRGLRGGALCPMVGQQEGFVGVVTAGGDAVVQQGGGRRRASRSGTGRPPRVLPFLT